MPRSLATDCIRPGTPAQAATPAAAVGPDRPSARALAIAPRALATLKSPATHRHFQVVIGRTADGPKRAAQRVGSMSRARHVACSA